MVDPGPVIAPPQLRELAERFAEVGRTLISATDLPSMFTLIAQRGLELVDGAEHELLVEQDSYRAQFWTAFDKFVV